MSGEESHGPRAQLEPRLGACAALALLAGVAGAALAVAITSDELARQVVSASLGGLALLGALVFSVALRSHRDVVRMTVAVDALAVVLTAGIVVADGAGDSLAAVLFVALGAHAAAFLPTRGAAAVGIVSLLGVAGPVLYAGAIPDRLETTLFAAAALTPVALATHLAADRLRAQRRSLMRRAEQALHLAEQDALTGLWNYRGFRRRLESEAARARRHGGSLALVLLDLDGFKAINDELGHGVGDAVLKEVADALHEVVRTEDVLCRQGGDEFAVIAVEATPAQTELLARRFAAAVQAHALRAAPGRRVSAGTGWASFERERDDPDGLVARADEALRRAKQHENGRGR